MADELLWLTFEDVCAIHRGQIDLFGGADGIRDANLVQSALASPINRHAYSDEQDLLVLTVGLCLALARNHGFVDGNKRTATAAMIEFLAVNSVDLNVPETFDENVPRLAGLIVAAIERKLTDEALVDHLRPFAFRT